jgi:hypothetical protein
MYNITFTRHFNRGSKTNLFRIWKGYKLSCTAEQKQYDETSSLRRSEEEKEKGENKKAR